MKNNNAPKKVENPEKQKISFFEKMASAVTTATGSTPAILIAFGAVLVWAVCGPFFNYSETWQLVINTSTTIVTFLMVFLIQKSQNKDSIAIHLKLNELVASHETASNRLVDIENISEDDLKVLQKYYSHLSISAKEDQSLQQTHSIDEAENVNEAKKDLKAKKGKSNPGARA